MGQKNKISRRKDSQIHFSKNLSLLGRKFRIQAYGLG
jgi:hypothetical protein